MYVLNRSFLYKAIALIALCFFVTSDALALTLSPVKTEISGDPGQTISAEVELYNEQAESKTFFVSFENFEPSGEDGSPKFVGGGKGLATWISSVDSITLSPGERQIVPYTITIPLNTEPGGYFGAIFFGGQNPAVTAGGEVSVGGKLGTLILLRVRGDIPENAGLLEFATLEGQRIFSELPVNFSYRIKNDGGDRIVPVGDITISNTFGITSETLALNETGGSILPSSARRFDIAWGTVPADTGFFGAVSRQWEDLHFGWYTAHARITWTENEDPVTARYDFFMIPWQLTLVSIFTLVIALMLLRKYNSWILSRARKS